MFTLCSFPFVNLYVAINSLPLSTSSKFISVGIIISLFFLNDLLCPGLLLPPQEKLGYISYIIRKVSVLNSQVLAPPVCCLLCQTYHTAVFFCSLPSTSYASFICYVFWHRHLCQMMFHTCFLNAFFISSCDAFLFTPNVL